MKAIYATQVGMTATGKRIVDALILSDDDPQALPTNGTNVDGLNENDVFAPFSMLYALGGAKVYIANESGVFTLPG